MTLVCIEAQIQQRHLYFVLHYHPMPYRYKKMEKKVMDIMAEYGKINKDEQVFKTSQNYCKFESVHCHMVYWPLGALLVTY